MLLHLGSQLAPELGPGDLPRRLLPMPGSLERLAVEGSLTEA